MRGHRAPELGGDGATCLIHTQSCIYALDDDGYCLDVISLGAPLSAAMTRVKGAQYVASLEAYSAEGLVPNPRAGVRALFVGRGTGKKQALLRTGVITRVDFRESERAEPEARHAEWGAADIELPWSVEDPTKTYQQLPRVNVGKA
ncbi:MAG: hypothetical protein R3B72_10670 [Polyangiaceae bacterium]